MDTITLETINLQIQQRIIKYSNTRIKRIESEDKNYEILTLSLINFNIQINIYKKENKSKITIFDSNGVMFLSLEDKKEEIFLIYFQFLKNLFYDVTMLNINTEIIEKALELD